jgi:hypothetical protein
VGRARAAGRAATALDLLGVPDGTSLQTEWPVGRPPWVYRPAWYSSQSASIVNPTMMLSIQYCERTAWAAWP